MSQISMATTFFEPVATESKVRVAKTGVVGTVVGSKRSDVRAGLELANVGADRYDDAGTLVTEDEGVRHRV